MTREEAITKYIVPAIEKTWNDKRCKEILEALEQEPILDRDCEHCSKTYGTLGCCTTVSNKWVYSCKEGQREYLLDKIKAEIENDWQLKKYPSSPFSCGLREALEIIDKYKVGK